MNFLALFLLVPAAATLALAWLVYRAAPFRSDNRAFVAIALLGAARFMFNTLSWAYPEEIARTDAVRLSIRLAIPLTVATLLFAWSFPLNRRIPRWLWVGTIAAGLAALGITITDLNWENAVHGGFLFPAIIFIFAFLYRNYRRVTHKRTAAGVVLVAIAFALPILLQVALVVIYPWIADELPSSSWLGYAVLAGPLVSAVLLAVALLQYHQFSARHVAGDVLLWGLVAIAVVGVGGAGVSPLTWLLDLQPNSPAGPMLAVMLTAGIFLAAVAARGRFEMLFRRSSDPLRGRPSVELKLARVSAEQNPAVVESELLSALENLFHPCQVRRFRTSDCPGFALANAPLVSHESVDEVRRRGFLAAEHIDEIREPTVASELSAIGADLLLPVQSVDSAYGLIVVHSSRVDRIKIAEARRAADALATKISTHHLFAELERSRRLAALGTFAAGLAHEIRNPLSSMRMNMQILGRNADLSDSDQEYLDIAMEEIDRLNAQLNDVLDFAKPPQLRLIEASTEELLRQAVGQARAVLDECGVSVRTEVEESASTIAVDSGRIRQVLLNLIVNAARASTSGTHVTITVRRVGSKMWIAVRDEGSGIDPEHIDQLFEPFFTQRADGTGLGLAIVDKIIRAHGGMITVNSRLGQGSEFRIELPTSRPPAHTS